MHIIRLDFKHGSASVDSAPIEVDENGVLVGSIAKLCSRPIRTNHGRTRYHLLKKVSVYGQSADGVIEVGEGRVFSLTLLFDLIEFFTSSIRESKVIKACEKSSNLKFMSNHPSTALLESCEWGSAIFFYDAKQGDLSLDIRFERRSTESNSKE
jgi:hypothetical protein